MIRSTELVARLRKIFFKKARLFQKFLEILQKEGYTTVTAKAGMGNGRLMTFFPPEKTVMVFDHFFILTAQKPGRRNFIYEEVIGKGLENEKRRLTIKSLMMAKHRLA